MRTKFRGCWSALCLIAAIGLRMSAGDVTVDWTGAVDTSWSNPANWSPRIVPNGASPDTFSVYIGRTPAPFTIRVDIPVRVRYISMGSAIAGTLVCSENIQLDDGMLWYQGTVVGPGKITGGVSASAGPGKIATLDGATLELNDASEHVDGDVRLVHHPDLGRYARIVISSTGTATGDPSQIHVSPSRTGHDLENYGQLALQTFGGLWTGWDLLNHATVYLLGSMTLTDATLLQDSGEMKIGRGAQILNGGAGRILITGGNLTGDLLGEGGTLPLVKLGGFQTVPVVLAGSLDFEELSLLPGSVVKIRIGGPAPDQYDHFTVAKRFENLGRLEVSFANNFEQAITYQDQFAVLQFGPDAILEGKFSNAQIGERILFPGVGSLLLAQDPDSRWIYLKDFQGPGFVFHLNESQINLSVGIRDQAVFLDPGAEVVETPGGVWPGGGLELNVVNEIAAEDHFTVVSTPTGPDKISTFRDPSDSSRMTVSHAGVPFATAVGMLPDRDTSSGPQLTFEFNAAATAAAIQALIRTCFYSNSLFSYDAFATDVTRVFPNRTVTVTLRKGSGVDGVLARRAREVSFARVVGLAVIPRKILVTARGKGTLTSELHFSDGHTSQITGSQVNYATTRSGNSDLISFIRNPTVPEFVDVRATGVERSAGEDFTFAITASAGPFSATGCVQLVIVEPATVCFGQVVGLTDGDCDVGSAAAARFRPRPHGLSQDRGSLANYYAFQSLMQQTTEGRRLASLYWRHGAEAVEIAASHPELILYTRSLLNAWHPLVRALVSAQGANALITQPLVDEAKRMWTNLIIHASPTMRADLIQEQARFHGFQDFVGKNLNQWAEMLSIAVPTQPLLKLSNPTLSGGFFSTDANHTAGMKYSLIRSDNLQGWVVVPGARFEINGLTLRVTDTNPPVPNSFYRLQMTGP